MNLKKIGKVFTSKFAGTGPSSYEKRIYRAGRGLTKVEKHCYRDISRCHCIYIYVYIYVYIYIYIYIYIYTV